MKKIIASLLVLATLFLSVGCVNENSRLGNCIYDIKIDLNEDMSASGKMYFTYYNNENFEVKQLKFNLHPNAFSEGAQVKPISPEYYDQAYVNGIDFGKIIINNVKMEEKPCNYKIGGVNDNLLTVNFEKGIKPKKSQTVFIDFSLEIPNVLHRFGYGDNTLNLTGFYPILCGGGAKNFYESVYYPYGDPFYSDVANYKVSLSVPSEYVVASSMSPTKTEVFGEETTYNYLRENVREIAFIMSKNFSVIKKAVGETEVSYYYYKDKEPKDTINLVASALNYFSNKFCKYPYKEYAVCQADFIYGGMEYPCLTLIDGNLVGEDKDYCIAHETAHEWWYGLVGVNESVEGFIDEGLTELSTITFLSSYKKTPIINYVNNCKSSYSAIRRALASSGQMELPVMTKSLSEYKSDAEYVSIAYYRSMLMFLGLKNYMGSKKFDKFLKSVVVNYKYKNINLNNLLEIAESFKKGSKNYLLKFTSGSADALAV